MIRQLIVQVILIQLFFILQKPQAQNLIPNPGFEKCDACRNGFFELNIGIGANQPIDWTSCTYGTSDFRAEQPRSGKQHGGFFTGFKKFEYLVNHLDQSLEAGAVYQFSFYIKVDTRNPFYALDEMGVYIQKGLPNYPQIEPLTQLRPQYVSPDGQYIGGSDYTRLSFEYTACGGEDHFIVGRFKEISENDTLFIGNEPLDNPFSAFIYYQVDDFEMTLISKPEPILPKSLSLCKPEGVRVNINPALKYKSLKWSTKETTPSILFTGSGPLIVEVILDNECNTQISDTVFIDNSIKRQFVTNIINGSPKICPGSKATYTLNLAAAGINQNQIDKVMWSNGSIGLTTIVDTLTKLEVEIFLKDTCLVLYNDFSIELYSLRIILNSNKNLACLGDTVKLQIIGGEPGEFSKFIWSTKDTGRVVKVLGPNSYSVTATNVCGVQEAKIEIKENNFSSENKLSLPNVIFPTQQVNNSFGIVKDDEKKKVTGYHIKIYNRWGNLVFESKDADAPWRPTENNQNETYLYRLEYLYEGCRAVSVGNLTVIK